MSFAVENFIYIEGDFYVKTIKINPAYTESRASFKIIVQQNLFDKLPNQIFRLVSKTKRLESTWCDRFQSDFQKCFLLAVSSRF